MDKEEVNRETEEELADAMCVEEMSEATNADLISGIKALLTDLSNRSPDEMRKGLEAMHEELHKMKTPSMCASLLCKVSEGVIAASTEKASIAGNKDETRCFVCDGLAIERYYILATCRTKTSKTRVIEKLGHLVGERYRVVISEDDIICYSCVDLINTLDSLETEMGSVRNVVLQYLEKKYGLEEGELLNNETSEIPLPQVLPASPSMNTAPTTEHIMSDKRKAALAELESEHQKTIEALTGKRVKNNPKKDIWMQYDDHQYATNFNFCTANQIQRHVKKKEKQPGLCEFCGGEIKAGYCSNNCSLKKRTDMSKTSTSGTSVVQNSRPSSASSSNFGRKATKPFSESMNCLSVSGTETVQMLASEINEYITATTEETVVTSAGDDNAVFLHVVEVGKADEIHNTSSVPEQVVTVANDGTVQLVEVIWNDMDSSHVSTDQDVQVLA